MSDKRFETLRAKAALARHELWESTGADGKPVFIVAKWAMTRTLNSLDEVERFLEIVGGRS